jgi:ABC-type microcin C transport system permease subunit YejB
MNGNISKNDQWIQTYPGRCLRELSDHHSLASYTTIQIEHATLWRAALLALFSVIMNFVAITFLPINMFWSLLLLNRVIFTAMLKGLSELSVRYAVAITLSH